MPTHLAEGIFYFMIIKTRETKFICELSVVSGSATITEDLAIAKNGTYEVDNSIIENLFTVAFDLSRYNEQSDLDTMKILFDSFLTDKEQADFRSLIDG